MDPSTSWRQASIEPTHLDPETVLVGVACYLEPGGTVGDDVEIDDIVVYAVP